MRKEHKSKTGGLTAAGRRYFKRKEGANLKPPVTGKAPKGSKAAAAVNIKWLTDKFSKKQKIFELVRQF